MENTPVPERAAVAARLILLLTAALALVAACTAPGQQPSANGKEQQALAQALAYSRCMRSHGVPNFPDPTSNGHGVSMGLKNVDPNSPEFKAAQEACHKLQPGPGSMSAQQRAQARADGLKMASCMHAHGFPTFPDPNSQGVIEITPADGLNTNSPQYQSAVKRCQTGDIMIAQRSGSGGGRP